MNIQTWQNDDISINVDYNLCNGHGECAENCPGEVYDLSDGKAVAARLDDCVECCTCVEVCPVNAIRHSSCI